MLQVHGIEIRGSEDFRIAADVCRDAGDETGEAICERAAKLSITQHGEAKFRELARAVGYKGRRRNWNVVSGLAIHDNYWDGGSRSYYEIMRPGGNLERLRDDNPLMGGTGRTLDLTDGTVVVTTGYYCGKVTSMRVYGNAYAIAKLLIEAGE